MPRARTVRKLPKSLSSARLNGSPREADHLIRCQSSWNCSPVKMGAIRNSTQKHRYSMPEHWWDRLWTPESRVIKKITLGAMRESQGFSRFLPSGLARTGNWNFLRWNLLGFCRCVTLSEPLQAPRPTDSLQPGWAPGRGCINVVLV